MGIEIAILVLVWFGAGGVLAIWTFLDMRRRKRMERAWIVIVFFLSILGLLSYIIKVKLERSHPYQYPPPPQYGSPEYKFKEPAEEPMEEPEPRPEKAEEGPRIQQVDGIPRCPHCGAAISTHDWECRRCGAKLRY